MNAISLTGVIRKMRVTQGNPISYELPVGESAVTLNDYFGQHIQLKATGQIYCLSCQRPTKKSFSQGYCFPCFKRLPECDMCIMKPETCHYHLGTCRDEAWADNHCMQDHYVYLANSSGIKVGITRGTQIPTRWIDQGAGQAIALFKVKNRLHSGLVEATIKKHINDRTDWRKMLKSDSESMDMLEKRQAVLDLVAEDLDALAKTHPDIDLQVVDTSPTELSFPVQAYPAKVTSLSFDKTPTIAGVLQGIKGQYLMFDSGVLNIRKFGGYEVEVRI